MSRLEWVYAGSAVFRNACSRSRISMARASSKHPVPIPTNTGADVSRRVDGSTRGWIPATPLLLGSTAQGESTQQECADSQAENDQNIADYSTVERGA